jgi:hypothetical protein
MSPFGVFPTAGPDAVTVDASSDSSGTFWWVRAGNVNSPRVAVIGYPSAGSTVTAAFQRVTDGFAADPYNLRIPFGYYRNMDEVAAALQGAAQSKLGNTWTNTLLHPGHAFAGETAVEVSVIWAPWAGNVFELAISMTDRSGTRIRDTWDLARVPLTDADTTPINVARAAVDAVVDVTGGTIIIPFANYGSANNTVAQIGNARAAAATLVARAEMNKITDNNRIPTNFPGTASVQVTFNPVTLEYTLTGNFSGANYSDQVCNN